MKYIFLIAFVAASTYGNSQLNSNVKATTQIANLYRHVTETYMTFRYLEPSSDRTISIAKSENEIIQKWLKDNSASLKSFAGSDADALEEGIVGWVKVCDEFASSEVDRAKVEADMATGSSSMSGIDYLVKYAYPVRVRRISNAFQVVKGLYNKHASLESQSKLAAATYYMLNGALLVTPLDQYDFKVRLLVPDLGLSASATIAHEVVTLDMVQKYEDAIRSWTESKGTNKSAGPIAANLSGRDRVHFSEPVHVLELIRKPSGAAKIA